ncbi:MAG: hypothetical protein H7256_02505 [Bdellovibrio sp.]|nr:hypothetical protein [Bdellovibrio sp.]
MRLEIEVLDGNQKGKRIGLTIGLLFGRKINNLVFADKMIAEAHAVLMLDHRNSWSIECLDPNTVRIGLSELLKIALIPGLIFHFGQTGFKVVEKGELQVSNWSDGLIKWFKENPAKQKDSEIFFFLRPLRLTFVQGPQYDQFLTIAYGPRVLGYNSLDLHLSDPMAPRMVARFLQAGEQAYIENLCGNKALINSKSFDQHPIQDEDLLKIGSTIIELSILK